jgi:RHH-type transcriptional regulator, rel operon repressor / antitoxin RelB
VPAIEITDELAHKIQQGAELTGESSNDFLREAVLSRLEDLDDIAIATDRINNPGQRLSFNQVKANLGLDG